MSFWVFILYIPFLLWAGHCLGMGFPFFDLAHVSFYPAFVGRLVLLPRHCIAPSTISLIFLSSRLIGWRVCHVNSLYYLFFWSLLLVFLLGQPIQYLGLPQSISFFGHANFILSYLFHLFLLNLLRFPGPITTSLPLGLLAFKLTLFTNSFLWASRPRPVCFFSGHFWFRGLIDHYSYHSSPLFFILLFSFFIFFILLNFFCH